MKKLFTLAIVSLMAFAAMAQTKVYVVKTNGQTTEYDLNEIQEITTVKPEAGNEGKLPGVFSISATKTVRFSQGNLRYCPSAKVWAFADNQWDIVGAGNKVAVESYTGWMDLFPWGSGDSPFAVVGYSDWGKNKISNGGNIDNAWYTMRRIEWTYLLENRTNAASKYGLATVNGVGGLVILPDVYTQPSAVTFNAGIGTGFSHNTLNGSEWAQMEANGAVFLPAAGAQSGIGQTVIMPTNGFYWTPEASVDASGEAQAYRFTITEDNLPRMGSFGPTRHSSVRLVSVVTE